MTPLTEILLQESKPWTVNPKSSDGTGCGKSVTYVLIASNHPMSSSTLDQDETVGSVRGRQPLVENERDSIVLIAGEERIKASRHVLVQQSDYFRAMFTTDMRESRQSVIEFADVSPEALHAILKFCQHEEVDVCLQHVHQLLHAANLFQLSPVGHACEHFLCSVISKDNMIEILDIADHYSAVHLLQHAFTFLRRNFSKLCSLDWMLQLKYDHLLALLQCNLLVNASEFEIFNFVKKWVGADVNSRKTFLCKLLQCVKFPLMALHELTTVNNYSERWLKDSPEFVQEMNRTIWYRNHIHEQPLHQSWQTTPRGAQDCLVAFMEDDSILLNNNELAGHIAQINRQKRAFIKKNLKLEWKRDGNAFCTWNGFLYVAGGYDPEADRNLATVHRYDPGTKQWMRAQSMLHRKANFTLDSLGDRLIATGGRQCDCILHNKYNTTLKTLDVVEWYNCKTDTWLQVAPMPVCLYGHASATLDDRLYICGGRCDSARGVQDTNLLCSYQSQSNTWTSHPPMHNHRYYHNMAGVNDRIYVMGGMNYGSVQKVWTFVKETECFNPSTEQWTLLSSLPHRRSQIGIASYGRTIFVLGGLPVPRVDGRKIVLEYNVDTDEWETSLDLQFPTYWPTVGCILQLPPDLYDDN